ncbi:PduM family microcompartment protein [Enterococcus sp. DIV1298c]|uniref:PduM family microcompartment protein n=1 Tax=Enterococcus sp. DIV1298c TaxID=2815328 RepID=UPI001A939F08|nr:PduM family microcompartment protein [Enterococcus sp. DIV1298c]MBO0462017.1 PduM family microcompartment protein [Enterococcus sp. DIV1298c]
MEEIIQKVVDWLIKREKSKVIVSADAVDTDSIKPFLSNKFVYVKNCDCFFLTNFARKNESDPFVRWLFRSLDYGCELRFQCSFSDLTLIPEEIFHYNVEVYTATEKPCYAFSNRYITYKQVAVLPNHAVLILSMKQNFTLLAQEIIQEKQMTVCKRSGSQC